MSLLILHIENADGQCKFWLQPIRLAKNNGIKPHTIRQIEKIIIENIDNLIEKYNEFHNN